MNKDVITALVQVLISLGGAGLLVQLLLLRQNRRKIAGDASSSEANAASTLSGAAMKMVENAQLKEREAETRAEAIQARAEERERTLEARRLTDAEELESRAWRIHHLEMRNAVLENALRQEGVAVPPEPNYPRDRAAPSLREGPQPRALPPLDDGSGVGF